ncbi:MAG: glucose-1-phosphate adenylyltransferase, partial [Chthoniobacterales bacterium]|nr:glucose-1-phosphate adenylyltransferase [Chthoniobacterales bacterium]
MDHDDTLRADAALARTLGIIMGGGAGKRLHPLTKDRSKPAVPLGGKYRLVDIPISNCLNAGIRGIYVLTQFNSASLHQHISRTYKFDIFSSGSFVEILAAQQTPSGSGWYQGTADAVRQNLRYFLERPWKYFLILSGDQLYQMDFRELMVSHFESGADLTIATLPVERSAAEDFGIMQTDGARRITRFVEKPKDAAVLESLRIPGPLLAQLGLPTGSERYQASMGIYLFNREALVKCLENDFEDFGKDAIPAAIGSMSVGAHVFQGYWEDIGTIRSFFEANLALAEIEPPFSFYRQGATVYSRPRFLPASKINGAAVKRAVLSDGCIITEATLERCVIGIRSIIETGAVLQNVVMMGADFYESETVAAPGSPPIGVGRNTTINDAIVDKNARIGERVVISPAGKPDNMDSENFCIRDGVVIVPKNAVIH